MLRIIKPFWFQFCGVLLCICALLLLQLACSNKEQVAASTNKGQKNERKASPKKEETNLYSGLYIVGIEHSDFYDCASKQVWWAEGQYKIINHYVLDKLKANPQDWVQARLFVKVEGILSPPGEYGHQSKFSRLLQIEKVTEMHEYQEECGSVVELLESNK